MPNPRQLLQASMTACAARSSSTLGWTVLSTYSLQISPAATRDNSKYATINLMKKAIRFYYLSFDFKQLDTDPTYEDLEDTGFPLDAFADDELIWVPLFAPVDADNSPTVLAA